MDCSWRRSSYASSFSSQTAQVIKHVHAVHHYIHFHGGAEGNQDFCCTQHGDYYFLKLHVSTELMSYKTKFSNGDFSNKSMLDLVPNRGINPSVGASIYKFGLSWFLFICLYPINVKTAEPIGPKFFVGHHLDHREGLWMIKIFQKMCFKGF